MTNLNELTVQELDMLFDGLTMWESYQQHAPNIIALNPQELAAGMVPDPKMLANEHNREIRGHLEAATLLKAKIIGRKNVLQADHLTKEIINGIGLTGSAE